MSLIGLTVRRVCSLQVLRHITLKEVEIISCHYQRMVYLSVFDELENLRGGVRGHFDILSKVEGLFACFPAVPGEIEMNIIIENGRVD